MGAAEDRGCAYVTRVKVDSGAKVLKGAKARSCRFPTLEGPSLLRSWSEINDDDEPATA